MNLQKVIERRNTLVEARKTAVSRQIAYIEKAIVDFCYQHVKYNSDEIEINVCVMVDEAPYEEVVEHFKKEGVNLVTERSTTFAKGKVKIS